MSRSRLANVAVELEIGHHALEREAQAVDVRVVDAVGRQQFFGFDVLGGHHRAHENEVVVEIGAVQDVAADRVEEGLGQFRLLVVGQHADVVQLGFAPHFVGQFARRRTRLPAPARIPARACRRSRCARAPPAGPRPRRRFRNGAWRSGWSGGTGGSACRSRRGSCARYRMRSGTTAVSGTRLGSSCFSLRVSRSSILPASSSRTRGSHLHAIPTRNAVPAARESCRAATTARRITWFRRTARGRSACGGFRWCRRRSRTAWRRATGGRPGTR